MEEEIENQKEEGLEEVEHDLIKDAVLELTNSKFNAELIDLPMGNIRKSVSESLTAPFEGKSMSRKAFEKRNWIEKKSQQNLTKDDGSSVDDEFSEEERLSEEGGEEEEEDSDNFSSDDSAVESDNLSEGSDLGDDINLSGSKLTEPDKSSGEVNIFSERSRNPQVDINKGNSIRNQLVIWENLIESRIKLHKALQLSNSFYQKEEYEEFRSALTEEHLAEVTDVQNAVRILLQSALSLQEALLKSCPEYSSEGTEGNENVIKAEESFVLENENHTSLENGGIKRKKSVDDLEEKVGKLQNQFKSFRDSIIQNWNDKTRLSAGKGGVSKFAILEQSTLKQIEQILVDKERLLKRTRTKRSKYEILTTKEKEETILGDQKELVSKRNVELDPEIFDDDDFYHVLLKDFIDRKTSDITDPTQLGRQWTKLQKLRNKMKRKVDTRATKGRRLRFTVHQKLVNFMAPEPYSRWEEGVETDVFRSLFGAALYNSKSPHPTM